MDLIPVDYDPFLVPVDHDPFTPSLTPVDHDPFAGDPEAAGAAMTSRAMEPAVTSAAQSFGDYLSNSASHLADMPRDLGRDVAMPYLDAQNALLAHDWSQEPLVGLGEGGELTGRLPALAGMVTPYLAGAAPGGTLSAGARLSKTPLSAVSDQNALVEALRASHLDDPTNLPLLGARAPITPPPHITTPEDMTALVNRYADLAQSGAVGRDWYDTSGNAILSHAGSPELSNAFAAGLARTSPGTDVASNTTAALTMHNQAMAGDPLSAGRFPNLMGAALSKVYYGGEGISGDKITPFMDAIADTWNPGSSPKFVNDIWNMRASEFANPGGAPYADTPTLGQHNFARVLADKASDELAARTGQNWSPQQTQASAWTGIKSQSEGTTPEQASFNFADALARNYAQSSWESAPGMTADHFPEFADAPLADRQAYHTAIRDVLTDPNGRDIIQSHLGMMTGQTFDAPGVFEGRINPGSQSPAAVGMAPGGRTAGIDPASAAILDTAERVRGILLRQDAVSWHKPTFVPNLKPADTNMVDVQMGRPLTTDEAQIATNAMRDATGTDFYSPIGTPQGYRFLNVPEASGIDNKTFFQAAQKAAGHDMLPDADVYPRKANSFYLDNNWEENPNGQNYYRGIGTGRPDLQRAAAQLLATLGPRVSKVEEDFARTYGWNPNRASRTWENPIIAQHAQPVVPNPKPPWIVANPPWGSDPPWASGSPMVIPVDHDPFAQ